MSRLYFNAILKSDVIFSEKSATTGGHSCLSYIPGSAFLGFCASKLYDAFEKQGVSYNVFHGGAVRFSNTYPLDSNGNITLPVPMSWHVKKGDPSHKKGKLITDNIFNLLYPSKTIQEQLSKGDIQPQQIREGFYSKSGSFILPPTGYRMKTAIDRTKGGKPVDAQLFGYESLNADSPWFFFVDFDDSISNETKDKVKKALTGAIKIGKSRTAEYGMVEVRSIDNYIGSLYASGVSSGHISFYCFSDIALRDTNTGAPTLLPDPSQFGLDKLDENAKFNPEKSFIRTRIYAPFNNHRKANDLERQVVCKGSVITFSSSEKEFGAAEIEQIKKTTERGVGMYLHDGLGQVFVNPDFLLSNRFSPVKNDSPFFNFSKPKVLEPIAPNDELYNWLKRKKTEHDIEKRAILLSENYASALLNGLKQSKDKGPGKAQWAQLREIALSSESIADMHKRLFDGEKSLCASGVSKGKWEQRFIHDSKWTSFSGFLKNEVMDNKKDSDMPLLRKALYLLGNRMPHKINQEGLK